MREDERDRVSRQGTEAWRRLKKEKNWNDWLKVGEALQVGREWAMNQAGTNKPEGKSYNMAFGEWMTKYMLDDMDKAVSDVVMAALPKAKATKAKTLKAKKPDALVWVTEVTDEEPVIGDHLWSESEVATGVYKLIPAAKNINLKAQTADFAGYDVCFLRDGDDERIYIKRNVATLEQAKAIAQAHHDKLFEKLGA